MKISIRIIQSNWISYWTNNFQSNELLRINTEFFLFVVCYSNKILHICAQIHGWVNVFIFQWLPKPASLEHRAFTQRDWVSISSAKYLYISTSIFRIAYGIMNQSKRVSRAKTGRNFFASKCAHRSDYLEQWNNEASFGNFKWKRAMRTGRKMRGKFENPVSARGRGR